MYDQICKARSAGDLAREDQLLAAYRGEINKLEPTFLGPTWQRDENGKFIVPDETRTLGWTIYKWCAKYLNPIDPNMPTFKLTKEQIRFILWWYAIDDNGDFVYRTGVLQRLKGWG